MAKVDAVQGQTTINQKVVAIAAEMVLVAAKMAAVVAVAAAMATVWRRWQWWRQNGSHGSSDGGANMAPTVAEGAANVSGGHL